MKTKQERLIFSRIAFCPHCFENNSPNKGDKCLIWHTTKHSTVVHFISGRKGTRGFTPHLFLVDVPVPKDVAEVELHTVCGICDVEIAEERNENGGLNYVITGERTIKISRADYIALWKRWKWTGLEID